MSRTIVVLVMAIVLLLTACGSKPCQAVTNANPSVIEEKPLVNAYRGPLSRLPTGTYPVTEIQITYLSGYGDAVAVVLADPANSGNFRYYIVSPAYITVIYDANDCHIGHAVVLYEAVTICLPKPGC